MHQTTIDAPRTTVGGMGPQPVEPARPTSLDGCLVVPRRRRRLVGTGGLVDGDVGGDVVGGSGTAASIGQSGRAPSAEEATGRPVDGAGSGGIRLLPSPTTVKRVP